MWIHIYTITYCITEKLSEAHNRLATFGIVAQDVSGSNQGDNRIIRISAPIKRKNTSIKQIKMAVCELYLSLAFLQKYQVVFRNLEDFYLAIYMHTTIRKFGVSKICDVFERSILCSTRLHLFEQKSVKVTIL